MRAALESLERQIARLTQLAFVLLWPALYSVALGYSAWTFRHRDVVATLAKNKLTIEQRNQMTVWVLAAAALVFVGYVVAVALARVRRKGTPTLAVVARVNRLGTAAFAAPFVAALSAPGVESTDPIWTVLLAVVAAAAVSVTAYQVRGGALVLDDATEPRAASRFTRWAAVARSIATALALVGLWAAYGFLLSRLSLANHHALNTRTIDLGYYDNVFYNSVHGRPLGCSFVKGGNHASAHFDPILILLSPLYLLYPRAEFLLVLQSVWLGAGVVPAYLIGRRALGRPSAGWVMALVYFLYPALHGANLYEFHSLALIAPLVLWLFYFLEERRWVLYGVAVVLLCLCREDLPLMLCFVGLYAILTARPGLARAGLATMAFSVAYYALVRGFFMPSKDLLNSGTDKAYSYAYYFDDLIPNKRGLADVAQTLLTNPMFLVRLAFGDPQKVLYLLQLFVPLALLPLFAKKARLTLVYGLLVCLLASRKPVFQVGFQYSAMIFPFAFAITPRALADALEARGARPDGLDAGGLRRAAGAFMVSVSFLLSWKFGALVKNDAFRGGFAKVARWPLDPKQRATYAELRGLIERIEPGASVLVTNRVGAHASNRRNVFLVHQRKGTNYVLVEEQDLGKQKAWHDDRVRKGELELVERAGPFALWRSKPVAAVEAPAPAVSSPPPPPPPSAAPTIDSLDFGGEAPPN